MAFGGGPNLRTTLGIEENLEESSKTMEVVGKLDDEEGLGESCRGRVALAES